MTCSHDLLISALHVNPSKLSALKKDPRIKKSFQDWNVKVDRFTHETREKGASWNSFTMKEGSKVEVVRACFDGGVSKQEDSKINIKWDQLVSSKHQRELRKLQGRWKREQQSILPGDATIMQAETIVVVEAARAICCQVQIGQIIFDLDGNLIDEWDNYRRSFHTRILHPFLQSFQPRSQRKK